MSKTALLFPGQGSQKIGMGLYHYENNPAFKAVFDQANEILGFGLTEIMFGGPDDSLRQTENTQPAIFLHSVALFRTLDLKPQAVAGHSLGEFSALAAAGVLSFEDALSVVRKRGELMQKAGTDNPGTMAAVIGMADEKVAEICSQATEGDNSVVVPANYNCPGQLVISGHETAIDRALVLLKENGCKIAKKLPVSGAFHSPLMQSAYEGLKAELEQLVFHPPVCPVYSNFTAKPTTSPDEIRSNLLDQLLNPVKWTQTLLQMQQDGFEAFTEIGPGNVLQGLVKRTVKGAALSGYE
ncbi:MAG: ACP S-malonyltransferase [Candidatus Cyclonatronum sp.]|uniref:ACP S-malonyltransferase n=1 Tax=Cyclonatronum sp. TaxID=3024185 RepID=UPI0025BF1DD7|nr:ACP S-malonyltransferase [Cyclonatronum sp.]MCC5933695.1 ACP S-malonyltransferase [Balneolales bacterium]MCH8486873.1 ACP S-malonyltransferase [Cyclonatronum sp.]